MKKIRLLFYFTFVFFLFVVSNVNAGTLPNWAYDLRRLDRAYIYNCTSSGCSSKNVNTVQLDTGFWIIENYNDKSSIDPYGTGITNYVGYLEEGILYSYNLYFCSNYGLQNPAKSIYTNTASTYGPDGNAPIYSKVGYALMDDLVIKYDTTTTTCEYPYVVTSFFVPSIYNSYVSVHFSSVSTTNNAYFTAIGYELEPIGYYNNLTSSDIENIINNSSIASSSSIEEVRTSVEEIKEQVQELQGGINDLNDNITNNDSSGATGEAGDFFSGFTTDTFGLTSVVTAPLSLINSITSNKCNSINLPIPFVGKTLTLPCMNSIYDQHFSSVFTLYQTITFGITAYWVCVRVFNLVKDFKNPDHDEIEVMEL